MDDNFILRTFRKFDGFGAKIALRLHGDEDVKNLIGAVLSIGMLLTSLLLSAGTFLDFVYKTNPSVTTSVTYGTKNLTFNHDNFFMAISFYTPLTNISGVKSAGNSTNDYGKMKYINELKTDCSSCNGTYSDDTFLLNLCSSSYFSNIQSLKSIATSKSKDIVNIFRTYSFCIPDNLEAVLQDDIVDMNKMSDTSFQIGIPINNVSIEFTAVSSNTKGVNSLDNALNVVSPPVVQVITPAQPTAQPTQPAQPSGFQPAASQPQPTKPSGTQPQPTQPSGTQPQPTQPSGTQPQPTQPGGTQPQPTQPGGTQPQPTQPGGTQPQPTQPGGTQPATNTQQPGTNTQPTQTGTQPLQPPPPTRKNYISSNPPQRHFTPRNLETVTLDSSIQPTYTAIINQFKANRFPKMLLLHRSIEINTANIEKITKEVFFMEVLDYTDQLLGTPVVYDVYIQKYIINIDTASIFSFMSSNANAQQEVMVISKIEKNSFDSISNDGAYLNFKFNSDAFTFNVKYVGISDVLGVFGSFYTTFALLAGILASLYNEIFLRRDMILSIFKFIENDPDPIEKLQKSKKFAFEEYYTNEKENKLLINSLASEEKRFTHFNIEAKKVLDGVSISGNIIKVAPNIKKEITFNDENKKQIFLREEREIEEKEIVSNMVLEGDKSSSFKSDNLLGKDLEISPNLSKARTKISDNNLKKSQTTKIENKNNFEGLRIKDKNEEKEIYHSIYRSLIQKKKEKKKVKPSIFDFFCMNFCFGPCKRGKMKKYTILEKCGEIIDRTVEINYLMRKMFEVDFIKKLILSERQRNLLKFQFRYLNFNNYEQTMNFLQIFDHSRGKLEKNLFDDVIDDNMLDHKNTDEKLLEGLKNYYNF
jgi:hypothetical protein